VLNTATTPSAGLSGRFKKNLIFSQLSTNFCRFCQVSPQFSARSPQDRKYANFGNLMFAIQTPKMK
jgi:hypothetical protein